MTNKQQTDRDNMRLLELATGSDFKIDEEQAVLRDVRVLGRESRNRRRYLPEAITRGKPLYENVRVNVDHPEKSDPGADRSVASRIGWLANIREDAGGLVGDLHYLKTHPQAGQIVEAAKRRPDLFGLSHNADGSGYRENGVSVIEEITRVRSVDIVSDPASTRSLFESMDSQEQEHKTMPKTLKQILESADAKRGEVKLLKVLLEQDGMGMAADMPVEAPADSGADDQIKSAFRSAIVAAFDDDKLDMAATLGKMKEILKAYDKLEGGGGEAAAKPEDKPAQESHTQATAPGDKALLERMTALESENKQYKTRMAVRELLESEGVSPNPAVIKALESLGNDADRKALLAAMPKTAGETTKPRSTGRIAESAGNGEKKPDFVEPKDSKDFAKQLTGGRR